MTYFIVIAAIIIVLLFKELQNKENEIKALRDNSDIVFADTRSLLAVINRIFFSKDLSLAEQSRLASDVFFEEELTEYHWDTYDGKEDFHPSDDPEKIIDDNLQLRKQLEKDGYDNPEGVDKAMDEDDRTLLEEYFDDKQAFFLAHFPEKLGRLNEKYEYNQFDPRRHAERFRQRYGTLIHADEAIQPAGNSALQEEKNEDHFGLKEMELFVEKGLQQEPFVTYDMIRSGQRLATLFGFEHVLDYFFDNGCDEIVRKRYVHQQEEGVNPLVDTYKMSTGLTRKHFALQNEDGEILGIIEIEMEGAWPINDEIGQPMLEEKLKVCLEAYDNENSFVQLIDIDDYVNLAQIDVTAEFKDESDFIFNVSFTLEEVTMV